MSKVKVTDWLSQWVSEWQGHLLSCCGQLKRKRGRAAAGWEDDSTMLKRKEVILDHSTVSPLFSSTFVAGQAVPAHSPQSNRRKNSDCRVVSRMPWTNRTKGRPRVTQVLFKRNSAVREGWRLQNGWIFGKVPKGGGVGTSTNRCLEQLFVHILVDNISYWW